MTVREGIIASARRLGISPVDLATAISYETGGTFDPQKRGPTTKWGTHQGLIQFGEPQAKRYGVDWKDPVGSQLGESGAVVNYLLDAGVQPGHGLLDIYSAINAGQVGKYAASDAAAGGAPGTVRDKVEKQMSGHRRNAIALLGGGSDADFGNALAYGGQPASQAQNALADQTPQRPNVNFGSSIQDVRNFLTTPQPVALRGFT